MINKIKHTGILLALMLVISMFGSVNVEAASNLPNLIVQEQKPFIVYTGAQNTITYTLENTSLYTAKNLEATPDVSVTDLDGFNLMSTAFSLSDTSVRGHESVTAQVEVTVDDTVSEGVYPIKLLLTYTNTVNETLTKEILTYIEVRNDDSYKEKISVVADNAESLVPTRGEQFTFEYTVNNFEGYAPTDVTTYIQGLPEEYFVLVGHKDSVYLGTLTRNIARDVQIDYYMSEETPLGSYEYQIVLEYYNADGNKVVRTLERNVFVDESAKEEGSVTVSDVAYPSSARQDQVFNVGLTLTNNSAGEVTDLYIRLVDNTVFIPKSPGIVKVDKISAGASLDFNIDLVATGDDLEDRNYPIEIEYSYNNGTETITDSQIVGVYINADSNSDDSGNAPKIIISEYKSEPQIVKAGKEFDLSLSFTNTNRSRTIYNVKAYITANESTEDTGNVFTPVGSSNTFYIDEIGPKEASNQSIRLFTVPDASPKTYNLTINFEYEDADGNTFTAEEFVGIPVTQVSKVEASDFNLPSEVMQGETNNLYFDIFNTGKAKVYNLMIKVQGDVSSDPASKYVGNLDVGSTDYFDAYIVMDQPGQVEGSVVITYEDAAGEAYTIEKPFSVNVMEGFVDDMGWMDDPYVDDMDFEEPVMPGSRLPLYLGIGAAVIGVIVVIVILRKRKKKKMEMMFDEAD